MLSLKEVRCLFEGMNPGATGLGDCGSLLTHLKAKKMINEEYVARHFPSIQQALEGGDLENEYWQPGAESPADGQTEVRSDMAPFLRLLEGVFTTSRRSGLQGVNGP